MNARTLFYKLLSVLILAALFLTVPAPLLVSADGEVTPDPAVEVTPVVPPPVEETPVVEEPAEVPVEPSDETSPVSEQTPMQPSEVIAAVPEGVELSVLNDAGEVLPLASQEAAETLIYPDPYLTSGNVFYGFTAADCDPLTPGEMPCSNPIQAAIDFIMSGYPPDDGTLYVQDGDYHGDVTIDASEAVGFNAELFHTLVSEHGSATTTINGYVSLFGMTNFTLQGFEINGMVLAEENEGLLTLQDLDVTNEESDGIVVLDQEGDVLVKNVKANQNHGSGLVVMNGEFWFPGLITEAAEEQEDPEDYFNDVTILSSEFNQNEFNGIQVFTFGGITLEDVIANENGNNGATLMNVPFFVFPVLTVNDEVDSEEESPFNDYPGVTVANSQFNRNGYFGEDECFSPSGINAESECDEQVFESVSSPSLNGIGFFPFFGPSGTGVSAFSSSLFFKNVIANENAVGGTINMTFGDATYKCSRFNSNGEVGIVSMSDGDIRLYNTTASNNGDEDYVLDASGEIVEVPNYVCKKVGKNPDDTEIPVTGEDVFPIPCDLSFYELFLPNLDKAKYEGLCNYQAQLIRTEKESLPGSLPNGAQPNSGFTANLLKQGIVLEIVPEGGSITVSFVIPEDLKDKEFVMYYWDPDANNGLGEWIVVPGLGSEGSFTPTNTIKKVINGVSNTGDGRLNATVNFSGTFVIVVK